MTTYGDQVFMFGGVPVSPASIVGLNGGTWYFVNPESGSDGADGQTPAHAVRTVNQAYQLATDGKNDVIVLMSQGDATADYTTYLTETLTWAKDKTHLIGAAAPSVTSPRARIAIDSSVTDSIDPALKITAEGCVFSNFQVFSSVGTTGKDANGVEVTGTRNYFFGVHMAGMGEAANGYNDRANGFSLNLNGGGENFFERCAIGLDTTAKGSAANSEIRFESTTIRNTFKDCIIRTFAEAAGHQFILAGANALEGTQLFIDCTFESKLDGGGTGMTEAISINATQNGRIRLVGSTSTDAADWEASPTGIVVENLVGSDPGIVGDVS
jgi:hypothetical protein